MKVFNEYLFNKGDDLLINDCIYVPCISGINIICILLISW